MAFTRPSGFDRGRKRRTAFHAVVRDSRHPDDKALSMYRLMKSEKRIHDHVISGPTLACQQIQVGHFQHCRAALGACNLANKKDESRYYILNESGQEYYNGTWID